MNKQTRNLKVSVKNLVNVIKALSLIKYRKILFSKEVFLLWVKYQTIIYGKKP
ncbi:hypothetical protein CLAUR_011150 [Clostridium felsineum]|nr:hypothetical protein CLAUR_011150 [Clostridium felsineum]